MDYSYHNSNKKDRRKRLKKDIYKTVAESLKLIKPILDRKMVRVNFSTDGGEAYKKIFATDFDSIIYNLIINSIESFEETKVAERLIEIAVESGDILTVHYSDNGHGLTEAFKRIRIVSSNTEQRVSLMLKGKP